jgi:hypothetical protein
MRMYIYIINIYIYIYIIMHVYVHGVKLANRVFVPSAFNKNPFVGFCVCVFGLVTWA